jgi:hypothetical protein
VPANDPGNVSDWNARVVNRVQGRSCWRPLYSQAKESGGVQSVDRGPAIGTVADETRDSLVARNRDKGRHETIVTIAMIRRRQPHH